MDRIRTLILAFLREEITAAEQRELDVWLDEDLRHRALLGEIQQADSLAESFAKLDRLDRARAWGRVRAYAEERRARGEAAEPLIALPVRRMGRWWAAAAMLVLLLAGGYFWSRYQKPSPVVLPAVAQVHDVKPGTNKAVLTLSGGRQIVLDSSREDTVLTEGAAIVAGSHGRLAYNTGNEPAAEVLYNTLATPRGGEYQLTLPDGTRVWLNAASSIRYPTAFTGPERKVEVTGEIYFEVVKNASKPFKVLVNGKQEVEVLGTSFNINAYTDEAAIKTTLLEGSVRVDSRMAGHPMALLRPGEQTQLGERGTLTLKTVVDLDAVVAWKNGLFAFTDADLPTVMRQLARWYNVEVSYEGDIPKREFNGKIGKSLTLDQVLKVLTKTRVHYSIDGNHLTIRP
jgi:transmembrane sensor